MKVKIEIEIDTIEDRNEIDSFLELLKHISIDTDHTDEAAASE